MRSSSWFTFCLAKAARRASKKQKNTAELMPLLSARGPTPLHSVHSVSSAVWG